MRQKLASGAGSAVDPRRLDLRPERAGSISRALEARSTGPLAIASRKGRILGSTPNAAITASPMSRVTRRTLRADNARISGSKRSSASPNWTPNSARPCEKDGMVLVVGDLDLLLENLEARALDEAVVLLERVVAPVHGRAQKVAAARHQGLSTRVSWKLRELAVDGALELLRARSRHRLAHSGAVTARRPAPDRLNWRHFVWHGGCTGDGEALWAKARVGAEGAEG
jgi:hypothetical protein